MKRMVKWQLYTAILLFLLALFFVWRMGTGRRLDRNGFLILSQEERQSPVLAMVVYRNYPLTDGFGCSVLYTNLKDVKNLADENDRHPSNQESTRDKLNDLLQYDIVKTKSEAGVDYYRIRVHQHEMTWVFNDVPYRGEDYVSIAHGEEWYLAFSRFGMLL